MIRLVLITVFLNSINVKQHDNEDQYFNNFLSAAEKNYNKKEEKEKNINIELSYAGRLLYIVCIKF